MQLTKVVCTGVGAGVVSVQYVVFYVHTCASTCMSTFQHQLHVSFKCLCVCVYSNATHLSWWTCRFSCWWICGFSCWWICSVCTCWARCWNLHVYTRVKSSRMVHFLQCVIKIILSLSLYNTYKLHFIILPLLEWQQLSGFKAHIVSLITLLIHPFYQESSITTVLYTTRHGQRDRVTWKLRGIQSSKIAHCV